MITYQRLSDFGRKALTYEEGEKTEPYYDKGGYLTIGKGHKLLPNEFYDTITKKEIERLFEKDINEREILIDKKMKIPLTENQYDALFILMFNIGVHGFFSSNIYKYLVKQDEKTAFLYWKKWNKSRNPETGKLEVDPVLVGRRAREVNLFKKPLTLKEYIAYEE